MESKAETTSKGAPAALLVAFFLACSAVAVTAETPTTLPEWKWKAADDITFAGRAYDDSAWERIALPATLRPGPPGTAFWLRTTVPLGSTSRPEGIWFLAGKSGVAFELYVNGVFAGFRGSLPPRYSLRSTHSSVIHIPESLIASGGTTLALRCAFMGKAPRLPAYRLGDASSAAVETGPVNFWNARLYALLAALCLFLGVYFVFLYAFRPTELVDLYYAFTLLFIALYFWEMGAENLPFAGTWFRALSRSGLVMSMAFLVPFLSSFFGFLDKKILRRGSLGVGLAFTLAFLANSGDDSALASIFTLSLLPVMLCIGFGVYVSGRAALNGDREAWPVLVGIVLGIVLSAYDVYHQVSGTEPFAWLQGIAFFLLNLSIFAALSMRQSRLKSDLERYANEVERKTAELGEYIGRLEGAGKAAAALALELDAAARATAASVEVAAERSLRIDRDTERQAASASEADRLVADFLASIDRVNRNLEEQTGSVERSAAAVTELSAGAESVAANIEGTASFAGGLAEKTGAGERSAAALAAAMDRVSAATTGIKEVVEAVNDFASRTNLLAINAAIEAAHAGASGRGFAIIAMEVKKLAQSQAEGAARIGSIAADISERVGEGARDAELVRSGLREIAEGAALAAGRLDEIRSGTMEQRRASSEISDAMEALAGTGVSIRNEAGRQADYSERVRAAVTAIAAGATEVRSSAKAIAQESSGIVEAVNRLRELASKSRELTASLSSVRGGT